MDNNIYFALLILAAIIIIGLHEWRYERRKQIDTADSINFDRCSDEEFRRRAQELREITEGKETG